jgi:DNA-binding LacI/PurR family transcriptional regulator
LEYLYKKYCPSVLVHCDLREWNRPVVGHIVPSQGKIKTFIREWAKSLGKPDGRLVAIAAMPPEPIPFPTIRRQRVQWIETGLKSAGFQPIAVSVPDYAAANAPKVIEECPNAAGYVCLSDEIAISVHQLLRNSRRVPDFVRVLGFDASPQAKAHNIASIGQHLEDIGVGVRDVLRGFFADHSHSSSAWPSTKTVKVPVSFEE